MKKKEEEEGLGARAGEFKRAARPASANALPLPGSDETLTNASSALKTGGLGAGAGMYVRGLARDAANFQMNSPVTKGISSALGATANFGKTLVTGDPKPIFNQPAQAATTLPMPKLGASHSTQPLNPTTTQTEKVAETSKKVSPNPSKSGIMNPKPQSEIINGVRQSDGVVIAPNGMEVLNGNPRDNLAQSRVNTQITPATDLRGFSIPGQFNTETTTFGNPDPIALAKLGAMQKQDQANAGVLQQQREAATMLFQAQKTLVDPNSSKEQIDAANKVISVFGGAKKDLKTGVYKRETDEGSEEIPVVYDYNDPTSAQFIRPTDASLQGPGARPQTPTIAVDEKQLSAYKKRWDSTPQEQKMTLFNSLPASVQKYLMDQEQ